MARKRPKQAWIEGMDPPTIKEIDDAADDYVDARDQRMAYLQEEIKKQAVLQQLMEKHALTTYEYEGKTVFLAPGPIKVKVKRKKGEGEAADDGDE